MQNLQKSAEEREEINRKDLEILEKSAQEREETHKKNLEYLERMEKDLEHEEVNIGRFGKILDTWEHQQAEYQKYLDSLPKK